MPDYILAFEVSVDAADMEQAGGLWQMISAEFSEREMDVLTGSVCMDVEDDE